MTKPTQEYLTTGQAARELQISPGTLQNWRYQGFGPKFVKHRRNVFYHRSEIERYKAENFLQFGSTSEWKCQLQNKKEGNKNAS